MRFLTFIAVLALPLASLAQERLEGTKFLRYKTKDAFKREITFYLSDAPKTQKLPVVLFIQGSGGQSVWIRRDGQTYGGFQNILLTSLKGRARVMIVEKPGVEFAFQPPRPGSAEDCSEEFLEQHTLPRWAEALSASLKAVRALPETDTRTTVVIGHSEGGIMAAKVAADNSFVTHVASLASGGPSQLFDMSMLYPSFDGKGENPAYETWRKIQKEPDSILLFAWGHPYRRWSSFCSTSVTEQLLKTKARIFIAQGSEDKNVKPLSFDILHAELVARGKDVTAERIEGVDHGFFRPEDKGAPTGFQELFGRVADWALGSAK